MRTQRSQSLPEVEQAHELLKQGKREEAYALVCDVLKRQPANVEARALRDRIDAEDFRVAVVRERERRDIFEDEDVSPLLPIGILIIGIVAALVASYLAFRAIRLGLQIGFSAEIEMGGRWLGAPSRFPVHNLLITPVLLYFVSGVCVYAYRRYRPR